MCPTDHLTSPAANRLQTRYCKTLKPPTGSDCCTTHVAWIARRPPSALGVNSSIPRPIQRPLATAPFSRPKSERRVPLPAPASTLFVLSLVQVQVAVNHATRCLPSTGFSARFDRVLVDLSSASARTRPASTRRPGLPSAPRPLPPPTTYIFPSFTPLRTVPTTNITDTRQQQTLFESRRTTQSSRAPAGHLTTRGLRNSNPP